MASLKFFGSIVCLTGFVFVSGCEDADSKLTHWVSDPTFAEQLDPLVNVTADMTLCPPKGYERGPAKSLSVHSFSWVGPETEPTNTLMYQLLRATSGEKFNDPEEMVAGVMQGYRENIAVFEITDSAVGKINGMKFYRRTWTGRIPKQPIEVKGTVWVHVEPTHMISISTQDLASKYDESFPLAEASLLTLTKQ
ncbi:MAG: hypothetical protein AAFN77_10120 [Planctomycetota bacterium]